jgi:hypothetical protein
LQSFLAASRDGRKLRSEVRETAINILVHGLCGLNLAAKRLLVKRESAARGKQAKIATNMQKWGGGMRCFNETTAFHTVLLLLKITLSFSIPPFQKNIKFLRKKVKYLREKGTAKIPP